jgi:hypothetical protein
MQIIIANFQSELSPERLKEVYLFYIFLSANFTCEIST